MRYRYTVCICMSISFIYTSIAFPVYAARPEEREEIISQKAQGLKNRDTGIRGRTAEEIIALDGLKGPGLVIQALKDEKNMQVKKEMIAALAHSEDRGVAGDIKEYLSSDDAEMRLITAASLAGLKDRNGIEELRQVVLDSKRRRGERSLAVRSLGLLGSEEAVGILAEALKDPDFALRLQAVMALCEIGTESAVLLISGMKDDPDGRVRRAAENALKRLKG